MSDRPQTKTKYQQVPHYEIGPIPRKMGFLDGSSHECGRHPTQPGPCQCQPLVGFHNNLFFANWKNWKLSSEDVFVLTRALIGARVFEGLGGGVTFPGTSFDCSSNVGTWI